MSQAGKLFDGTILPDIETLTGNAGGAVGPTGGNINVVGDGTTISITGNPGTSTLTAAFIGSTDITITGDTGGAQTGNAFTFNGGTTGLSFGGAADVFTTTFAGITANGGAVSLGTDNAGNAITIGTGTVARNINIGLSAAPHVINIGVNNGASSLGLNAGTGDMTLISGDAITLDAAGLVELNSTGAAINIGNDANNFAVNVGTAGARAVTVGNTTAGSSLALRYGTADFTLASATGTVMSALDTGEIIYPLQPAFLAVPSATLTDVTGDGTAYNVVYDTEIFDQNSDFSSTTFTAPVTGRYQFNFTISLGGILVANSVLSASLITSNRNYTFLNINPFPITNSGNYAVSCSVLADMDAGDTCLSRVNSSGGTKVVDVISGGTTDPRTWFSGFLSC